jgi:hypothetical protein
VLFRFLFLVFMLFPIGAFAQAIGTVNFPFDSDQLDADAQAQVMQIAIALKARQSYKPTVVVGFTDAVGASGYNDDLGLRRAKRVVAALEAEGVAVSRIGGVSSRGERELLVSVLGPERQNRRVTVTLGEIMAACRTYREVPITQSSVGAELQGDLSARLVEAVGAFDQLANSGTNGSAFQMAGSAREDCGIAVGYAGDALRKAEYAQKCFCSSARMRTALGR